MPAVIRPIRSRHDVAPGRSGSASRRSVCLLLVGLICGPVAGPGLAQATWQGAPARQVVVFGVMAKPNSTEMDPKIAPVVQAQLRKLLPNHGFRLIKIQSERLTTGKTVNCELGEGFVASARLANPLDQNGKVHMHFDLKLEGTSQFQTIVATPPDQFNFFDKALPNANRLLIGVGAR